jgi:1,4-alpha-glucan branching enzyme
MVMKRDQEKKLKKGDKTMLKKQGKNIEFVLDAPGAENVFLAGEFNQWDICSLPMKKGKDGIWRAEIRLFPGCYEYKFFSDNTWVEDLPDMERAPNPFGTQNLVIRVD